MAPAQEMAAAPRTSTKTGSLSPPDDGKYEAHNLTMLTILPMAVKAFCELGIADILQYGKEPMSAEEIAAKLPTKSETGAARNLKRLFRPLVREGVVSESLNHEKKPVFGLTEISKWFTSDNDFSVLPHGGLYHSREFMSLWPHLKEVVLDATAVPFFTEYGIPLFEYTEKNPGFRTVFHDCMSCLSKLQHRDVVDHLQHSGVLEGVHTFVDVGGSMGTIVGHVVAQNANMRGINYDLPDVIAAAPPVPGVKYIGGDFLNTVPSGDAIFMKLMIHFLGDEEAIQVFKNCFEALPKNGKVIVAEYVLNDGQEKSAVGRYAENLDITMMAIWPKGKERTGGEYKLLMEAAGFSQFRLIVNPGGMDLVQAIKV